MVLAAAATLLSVTSAFLVFHSLHTHLARPAAGLNPALPGKSIAALPLENVSHEPDSASSVRGAHEDVLTKLAKITDLKVARIATTSAPFVEIDQTVIPTFEQYRTAPKIVEARQRHKRVARVRTPWHKLLYGWVAQRVGLVKTK
jgi:hypothetical protein